MTAPGVAAFTRRLYDRLPEFYRDSDPAQHAGTPDESPLLRYLSLLGDQAGELETYLDRVQAGELTDPVAADAGWLPWLARMLGLGVPPYATEQELRDAIIDGASGRRGGTRDAIAAVARRRLSGTRWVSVVPAPPWGIRVSVRGDEFDGNLENIRRDIERAGAKPAGYEVAVVTYTPTWGDIDAAAGGTWGGLDAGRDSWADVDSTGGP